MDKKLSVSSERWGYQPRQIRKGFGSKCTESRSQKMSEFAIRLSHSVILSLTLAKQHLLTDSLLYLTIMKFPPSWELLQSKLMDNLVAPDTVEVTVQTHAQLCNTGRILDGFQHVLGGTQILDAEVNLGTLVPSTHFNKWKLKFQFWQCDITIG